MPNTLTHKSQTLTELLSHLIRMPTITGDQATNTAALDWITEQLRGLPLTIQRSQHNGFPALVATTPAAIDRKNPQLWLAGHIDVVPGIPAQFKPHISGGKLYGRGAFDMKYGIACFIRLLQELGPELAAYDLGLMITTDEETGGINGTSHLVNAHGYRGRAVILPESGTSWTLETGSKGIMRWRLESHGEAAHASRPWTGRNAIDQLIQFVQALQAHLPTEPCGDPDHLHSTINLGKISGGKVANQVPESAEAFIDIRLMPGSTTDQTQAWVAEIANAIPGVQAHYLVGNNAIENPPGAAAALFRKLSHEIAGQTLTPMLSHGASDGRYFARHNIPVISVPPTGGGQHSDSEWVELDSLNNYYEIVRRFAAEWAGPERSPRPTSDSRIA